MNSEKIISLADEIKRNSSANAKMAADIERLVREVPPPPRPEPPEPPGVLARAVLIGNPGWGQYPGEEAKYCHARSTHDLKVYQAGGTWRCLVGYGDHVGNIAGKTGQPITVWSFAHMGGAGFEFRPETTIGEESAWVFVEGHDGTIYMPGIDPVGDRQGAIYINSNGVWTERETVKDAIHLNSLAVRNGDIYVLADYEKRRVPKMQILKSSDQGRSWVPVKLDEDDAVVPRQLVTAGDYVLIFGSKRGIQGIHMLDAQDGFATLPVDPFPTLPATRNGVSRRAIAYGPLGVLYVSRGGFDSRARKLLYFDLPDGARMVADFTDRDEYVQDIVVRGDTAYVLTAVRGNREPPFTARVYAACTAATTGGYSPDSWRKVADVAGFPAGPSSLEVMEGKIFVGVSNGRRGIPGKRPDAAYAASGNIYMLA